MEQMDLGRCYAHAASKCQLPAEDRYGSIAELKSAIRHPWPEAALWTLAGVIAAVAIIVLIIVVVNRNHHSTSVKPTVNQQDTITSTVSVQPETVTPMVSAPAMSDEVQEDVVSPKVAKKPNVNPLDFIMSEPVEEPSRGGGHYGEALSTGGDELAFALHGYVTQHRQDTLTDVKYLILDYDDMKRYGHEVIDKYLSSIYDQFTDRDLDDMRSVLLKRCDGYVNGIEELVRSRNP